MQCCPDCIGDSFFEDIAAIRGEHVETCECCGSEHASAVDTRVIAVYFEPLLSLYDECSSAAALPLLELLRKDWALFEGIGDAAARRLLAALLPDHAGEIQRFVGKPPLNSVLADWPAFRQELKHKNRFFLSKRLDGDGVKELFGKCLEAARHGIPDLFYRARTCETSSGFSVDLMGAPPCNVVQGGRANPRGISYLYVASDSLTAIHEVRPHKGEYVAVAEFRRTSPLVLADLRDPRKTISPFRLSEEELLEFYSYVPYISRLGEELSQPVLPRTAELEYLPSQYLCEFIKHCGFDGVIYKSAVGDGTNFALFSETAVQPVAVEVYQVEAASVECVHIPTQGHQV